MNYKVETKNDTSMVIETATEQIIKIFKDSDEAKKLKRSLNLGGAFDGWTPSFFTFSLANRLPENKKNINKKRKNK